MRPAPLLLALLGATRLGAAGGEDGGADGAWAWAAAAPRSRPDALALLHARARAHVARARLLADERALRALEAEVARLTPAAAADGAPSEAASDGAAAASSDGAAAGAARARGGFGGLGGFEVRVVPFGVDPLNASAWAHWRAAAALPSSKLTVVTLFADALGGAADGAAAARGAAVAIRLARAALGAAPLIADTRAKHGVA